jgi:IS5 family transposase
MNQLTFAEAEYNIKKRKTRREKFLERMDELIPWHKFEQQLARKYMNKKTGRKPYPLKVMLRIHIMQLIYNLSDPAMEDSLYEIESMRRFAGLKLADNIPDETTILNFRHFVEKHKFGKRLFESVLEHLDAQGLKLQEGSIVDASIISAPSSTKNKSGSRDPEMHQTKKGNEWHFGMKVHVGVDDACGLVHSLETTPANVHDITQADKLLHGNEERVWGDAGYTGIEKRDEHKERKVDWFIAMRPGKRSGLEPDSLEEEVEKLKASTRAKVEHVFFYLKRMFGYSKVRYRGLEKNTNRLYLLAGFANLLRAERFMTP